MRSKEKFAANVRAVVFFQLVFKTNNDSLVKPNALECALILKKFGNIFV